MSKKKYLDICINDRGFVNKPPQMGEIAPTLRAQDHGNPPKIIEVEIPEGVVVDDTYGFDETARVYNDQAPTLRSSRQGLKIIEKSDDDPIPDEKRSYIEKKLEEFVAKNGYIPKAFNPYNCSDVSELAPTVTAACGSTTTSATVLIIEEDDNDIQVIGRIEQSGHDHGKRVHSIEGISPTLTAVAGGTHHIKIFDPKRYRVRKLTPNEYGRLQAFPIDDGWEQVVSDTQAYRQFGNAVTTTVAQSVAEAIKNYLQEIEQGGQNNGKEELPDD